MSNLRDLIARVLRQNQSEASQALGVDYGWLRKAASVGLSRVDARSREPLGKIAGHFRLPVEELWTPNLLVRVWAGGHLPDVRTYLVERFQFDEYVRHSKDFQINILESEEAGTPGPPGASDRGDDSPAAADRPLLATVHETVERTRRLLVTGRHDFLVDLIAALWAAEQARHPPGPGPPPKFHAPPPE